MKTAATIVLILAVIGMFPKHKKHGDNYHPPPQISQVKPLANLRDVNVDRARVSRIVAFSQTLNKKSSPETLETIAYHIVKYSEAFGIEPELVAALIGRESRFNPNAVSHHGAKGLGQLISSTFHRFGGNNPFDIEQNIHATVSYLRELSAAWPNEVDKVLAAYNLGPRGVSNGNFNNGVRRFINDILEYRSRILSF